LVSAPATPGGTRPWGGWAGLVLAGVIVAFYFWTAQSPQARFDFDPRNDGYYNLLTDGFRAGKASLAVEPDPGLLKLADPYEPTHQELKLHDASFYGGKYYLYFGAAPALVWFLPFKLLTGHASSDNFGVALLAAAGFLTWTALWRRILRRHFPAAGPGGTVVVVGLLGLATMVPVMLRRAGFWEVPIAGAYFFNALYCTGVYRAVVSSRRTASWLVVASLALGFAIASRPGNVFAALGLGLVALWLAARTTGWVARARRLAAAVVPVSGCILAVMAYNYVRFDSPLEFGTTYQLAGHNMRTWRMLDWANVPINVYHYFLSPAQFSVYFPFFEVIGPAPFQAPAGYYGVENVYGVLPNLPVTLLGVAVLFLAAPRVRAGRGALAAWAGALLLAFVASLPASRYMVDFVPFLTALAVLGILAGEEALAGWRRRAFRTLWVVTAGYTMGFNVLVSLQHNDLLRSHDPATYGTLARVFNRVSPLLERLTGDDHGPLELEVRLPKDRKGKLEPLVVTGHSFRADYIYAYYTDERHVQFGFEHTGYGGGVSQPIVVDYDAVQTIRIEMGSFYPPETHPYFAGRSPAEINERKRRVRIAVNGITYLELGAASYESSPKDVAIGRDPIFATYGPRFTGTVVASRRSGAEPAEAAGGYGTVRLAVQFPGDKPGAREPLVVTGVPGRGDILSVRYLDGKSLRIALDHWGYGEVVSEPLAFDPKLIHVLDIDFGSLHAPPPGAIPEAGFTAPYDVRMDGQVVLQGEARFHPAAPGQVHLLFNPIGGSTAGETFGGRVVARQRPRTP
jgi:hypothetical protein